MKLEAKYECIVHISGITLVSCSDYHRIYIVDTVEKYPRIDAYSGNEFYVTLDDHSPDYNPDEQDTWMEFVGFSDDWKFTTDGGGRYSFIAIAYKETPECDKFLNEI